jgi:hypothetical protein
VKKAVLTLAAIVALTSASILPASAGCYRLGLTGYHWYHYCAGPHVLYPHHKHCNKYGFCWFH